MPRCFVINIEIHHFEFLNKKFAYYRPIALKVGSTYRSHRRDYEK